MNIGDQVENFAFKSTLSTLGHLQDYRGSWVILYFYPKDNTPGCTIESKDFRDAYPVIQNLSAVILGVSRDSLGSHEKFREKLSLPFDLIADENEELCQLFDVIKMKSMYGKKLRGIERSTFLIDPQGALKKVWRAVKVIGHVDEVIATIKL